MFIYNIGNKQSDEEDSMRELNELGRDGWEAVTMVPSVPEGLARDFTVLLKRVLS